MPHGNIIGFLIGGKTPGQFSVRRTDDFDISDAVLLPSGELLVLERKFSWLGGVGIRIRSIPLQIGGAGRRGRRPRRSSRPISATRSTTWKASTPIVTPEGDTVLTMVSDDNFSMIQRNSAAAVHAGGVSSVFPSSHNKGTREESPAAIASDRSAVPAVGHRRACP